jgi:hypothetical protein
MKPEPPLAVRNCACQPRRTRNGWTSLIITRPPGRTTRASSAIARPTSGRCTSASAQTAASTDPDAKGSAQVRAVAPGSACGIEHDRSGERIEQAVHGRLLDREQAQGPVIGLWPEAVSLHQIVLGRREGRGELGRVLEAREQRADLIHPGAAGVGVSAERQTQQRQALDPEQQLAKRRFRAHRCPEVRSGGVPLSGSSPGSQHASRS